MKKFRSKYISDATVFDKTLLICYFETILVRYGKIVENGKYRLELLFPFIDSVVITIYYSKKKPKIRSLYLIGTLWLPLCILAMLLMGAIILAILILHIFFGFFYQCLFKKSFITTWQDTLVGYISLILSIIGLISLIKFFI